MQAGSLGYRVRFLETIRSVIRRESCRGDPRDSRPCNPQPETDMTDSIQADPLQRSYDRDGLQDMFHRELAPWAFDPKDWPTGPPTLSQAIAARMLPPADLPGPRWSQGLLDRWRDGDEEEEALLKLANRIRQAREDRYERWRGMVERVYSWAPEIGPCPSRASMLAICRD